MFLSWFRGLWSFTKVIEVVFHVLLLNFSYFWYVLLLKLVLHAVGIQFRLELILNIILYTFSLYTLNLFFPSIPFASFSNIWNCFFSSSNPSLNFSSIFFSWSFIFFNNYYFILCFYINLYAYFLFALSNISSSFYWFLRILKP